MMTIEEYAKAIGVEIKCFEGNFYVKLPDYEKLLEKVRELEKGENKNDKS